MAVKIKGQKPTDNLIDNLLSFNVPSTWSVTGTGTASISSTVYSHGSGSLYIENTDPTNDILANNTAQSTLIAEDGDYNLTFSVLKTLDDVELTGEIQIFKDAVLYDTQTFSIGSTTDADQDDRETGIWTSYVGNQRLSFTKGQVLTIKIQLDGVVGFTDPSTFAWFDDIKLERANQGNRLAGVFSPATSELYNDYTGWGNYADDTYTTGSPFSVTDGAAAVDLPNDAGTSDESQIPIDVASFYDGTVITGRDGDGINITIEFKCRPTGAGADPRLTVAIDIGGAVGELYTRDFVLSKGNGVEHYYLSSFNAYTLNTWETNGGTVKVSCENENIEIYDIRYIITRTHKAR